MKENQGSSCDLNPGFDIQMGKYWLLLEIYSHFCVVLRHKLLTYPFSVLIVKVCGIFCPLQLKCCSLQPVITMHPSSEDTSCFIDKDKTKPRLTVCTTAE